MSRDDQSLKTLCPTELYTNKNEKQRITTLSQQFQNLIENSKKEAKSITHIYMAVHLTWFGAYTSITSFGVSQASPLGEMRLIIEKKTFYGKGLQFH